MQQQAPENQLDTRNLYTVLKVGSQSASKVAALVIVDDRPLDLLPHLLAHYRALGVVEFHFLVDPAQSGALEYLLGQADCALMKATHGFKERFRVQVGKRSLNPRFVDICKFVVPTRLFKDRWGLVLDAHDFLVLPEGFQDLPVFAAHLASRGLNCCRAAVADCFPETLGHLAPGPDARHPLDTAPFFDLINDEGPDRPAGAPGRVARLLSDAHPQASGLLQPDFQQTRNKLPLLYWGLGPGQAQPQTFALKQSPDVQMALARFLVDTQWQDQLDAKQRKEPAARRLSTQSLSGPKTCKLDRLQSLAGQGLAFCRQPQPTAKSATRPIIFKALNSFKPEPNGAVLFSMLYNEKYFLPHFLAHYRGLGVRSFVFLDDASTDGTREFLLAQSDCMIMSANHGYGDVIQGLRFHDVVKQGLPQKTLSGRWVLSVDADEFLLLPPGFATLDDFCRHLDAAGTDHSRALMLDFFPPVLADMDQGSRDVSPFALNACFDALTQVDWPDGKPRPERLSKADNVRARLYNAMLKEDPRLQAQIKGYQYAALNKVPLLKWGPGAHAIGSHRVSVTVSDKHQVALAHFKFFPGWKDAVANHVQRAVHWNGAAEYRMLALAGQRLVQRDLTGPSTHRYAGPEQLARLGLVFTSSPADTGLTP